VVFQEEIALKRAMKKGPIAKRLIRGFAHVIGVLVLIYILLFLWVNLIPPRHSKDWIAMMHCMVLAHALASYEEAHGHLPEGKTSTEVFQNLLDDGGFGCGPEYFYVERPGKVPPTSDRLRPESVCFDVTFCSAPANSDKVPLVFLTGYRVVYQARASAMPINPMPERSWSEWFFCSRSIASPYMVFSYGNGGQRPITASSDGTIPNFIPADFDAKGKTYRQLTP
jgi:hypothetical protein